MPSCCTFDHHIIIPNMDAFSGDYIDFLDWEFGEPGIGQLDHTMEMQSFTLSDQLFYSSPSLQIDPLLDHDQQLPLLLQDDEAGVWNIEESMNSIITELEQDSETKYDDENVEKSKGKRLTKKELSKYFYMPITQAAKELNMGLTLLKKWCRQLGIRRWPHRKLMSLKTLMRNVEEGSESEEKKREWRGRLEEERRLIEEMPDMQMHHNTKRLRQSCFKENYKKRRRLNLEEDDIDIDVANYNYIEDELRSCLLFCDSLSPTISDLM